ncbi:MAG: hypothetical protein OXB86_03190 [Bdellovibrionales bacterium]|nr:hypothetical protein [Bdellovibrionales bacterium]
MRFAAELAYRRSALKAELTFGPLSSLKGGLTPCKWKTAKLKPNWYK